MVVFDTLYFFGNNSGPKNCDEHKKLDEALYNNDTNIMKDKLIINIDFYGVARRKINLRGIHFQ